MGDKRTFEVAGVSLELAPHRPDLDELLPPPFTAFEVTGEGAGPDIRVTLEESREMEPQPLPFFLPFRFELWGESDGYTFVNLHERVKTLGTINPRSAAARFFLPPAGHDWGDPDVTSAVTMGLSDFLKTCLQLLLLERGCTLVHASGVERKGSGYIFSGPSGAGKSTAARLLEGEEGIKVLNDDLVAVCVKGGAATVHATPWTGSKGGACNPGKAPLACVFCLSREGREGAFRLQRMDRKGALKEVLSNLPWLGGSERLADVTVAAAAGLVEAVPFHALSFPLGGDLWGRIEEALAG